eukprot:6327822-Amphidinium_carterae.1
MHPLAGPVWANPCTPLAATAQSPPSRSHKRTRTERGSPCASQDSTSIFQDTTLETQAMESPPNFPKKKTRK